MNARKIRLAALKNDQPLVHIRPYGSMQRRDPVYAETA
tara:strand:- start:342 stop:455 length:114 start_codon:yes stop_codon:yes gene_type:complete